MKRCNRCGVGLDHRLGVDYCLPCANAAKLELAKRIDLMPNGRNKTGLALALINAGCRKDELDAIKFVLEVVDAGGKVMLEAAEPKERYTQYAELICLDCGTAFKVRMVGRWKARVRCKYCAANRHYKQNRVAAEARKCVLI